MIKTKKTSTPLPNLFFILITLLLLVSLVVFPAEMLNAAADGLKLWFNIVFPSLFPFMVGINILTALGAADFMGKLFSPIMKPLFNVSGVGAYPFVMGIFSGYPVGAKITADLRENNKLTQREAQIIMSFSNNPGPLFVLGTVASGMLVCPTAGYFMMLVIFLSSVTTGIVFRCIYKTNTVNISSRIIKNNNSHKNINIKLGYLMGESVRSSIETITQVGGFIILFSVITRALSITGALGYISGLISSLLHNTINSGSVNGYIAGIIEMTNGSKLISSSSGSFSEKVILITSVLSFGGISILAQTISILGKTDIKIGVYIISKIINSLFAGIYALLLYPVLDKAIQNSIHAFKILEVTPLNRFTYSTVFITFLIAVLILTELLRDTK